MFVIGLNDWNSPNNLFVHNFREIIETTRAKIFFLAACGSLATRPAGGKMQI
jgi:hypothetical protein